MPGADRPGAVAPADPVRRPSVRACCAAVLGLPAGWIRPRRADHDLLSGLVDAGLPSSHATVSVRALPQVPGANPTPFVVEGCLRPRGVQLAMTTFLVEHPRARFLIDPAICEDVVRRAVAQLPMALRLAVRPSAEVISTAQALEDVGSPAVDFALPTHLHWDHVSGLLDLPDLSIKINSPELAWAMAGPVAPVGGVRDALRGRETDELTLDGPAVLTFSASHDVFGDGSVIMVDLAGHTPGSVGVLLHTARGWVLLAGDAAWHRLQVDRLRQKASYPGALADVDRGETFRTLHRLHAAASRVFVVPAHDHDAAQAVTASG